MTTTFASIRIAHQCVIRGVRYERTIDVRLEDGTHRNVIRLDSGQTWWLPEDFPVEMP